MRNCEPLRAWKYLPTLSVPVPLPVASKRALSPTRLLAAPTTPVSALLPEPKVTAPTPLFQAEFTST